MGRMKRLSPEKKWRKGFFRHLQCSSIFCLPSVCKNIIPPPIAFLNPLSPPKKIEKNTFSLPYVLWVKSPLILIVREEKQNKKLGICYFVLFQITFAGFIVLLCACFYFHFVGGDGDVRFFFPFINFFYHLLRAHTHRNASNFFQRLFLPQTSQRQQTGRDRDSHRCVFILPLAYIGFFFIFCAVLCFGVSRGMKPQVKKKNFNDSKFSTAWFFDCLGAQNKKCTNAYLLSHSFSLLPPQKENSTLIITSFHFWSFGFSYSLSLSLCALVFLFLHK